MIGALTLWLSGWAVAAAPPPARPAWAAPPAAVTIATPRGTVRVPVERDAIGGPVLAAGRVAVALEGRLALGEAWAELTLGAQTFRFLVGAPLLQVGGRIEPLAAPAVRRDALVYLPFQFVVEVLPRLMAERYRYDVELARLVELAPPPPPVRRLPNGLLPGHLVTVDAGHGGADEGNPGLLFPRGIKEKHVTLQMALLLQEELQREGIRVQMTRTTDVLPPLFGRARQCLDNCDLFISLHVDALDPRRRRDYRSVNGFSTYIIGEENTEDASRVANMENESLRYESPEEQQSASALEFIFKDLAMNEHLRESARAAELIQERVSTVHVGRDRGVKQVNNLAVLNTARRPALLVEMGYSTSPVDARFLTTAASQRQLARALAQAVVAYLLEYERKAGARSEAATR